MIPTKIKIAGHVYSIKQMSDDHMNMMTEENESEYPWNAYIQYTDNLIALRESNALTQKEQSIAHEVLHAIIENSHAYTYIKKDALEDLIKSMENVFYRFLKDNTDVYK